MRLEYLLRRRVHRIYNWLPRWEDSMKARWAPALAAPPPAPPPRVGGWEILVIRQLYILNSKHMRGALGAPLAKKEDRSEDETIWNILLLYSLWVPFNFLDFFSNNRSIRCPPLFQGTAPEQRMHWDWRDAPLSIYEDNIDPNLKLHWKRHCRRILWQCYRLSSHRLRNS